MNEFSLRGVDLGDVYERNGILYRVIALCDKPQATLLDVATGNQEEHVIGCRNWNEFTRLAPLSESKPLTPEQNERR